jgi:hypothetical protein
MNDLKQRKHERRDSLNLVDYVLLDRDGEQTGRGMGRTRNVSEGGLLLETYNPLSRDQTILITLGLEEDMVELNGKVVHVGPSDEKGFCSGIELREMDEEGRRVLKAYTEALKAEKGD